MYKFKQLSTNKEIDMLTYLKDYLASNPECKMYIGTDSQNHNDNTDYGIVIVLHRNNKGGHVLYAEHRVPRIRDMWSRLWSEMLLSLEVADYLVDNGIQKPDFVDVDFSPDPKYKSNNVIRAALGYIESMGYAARCKPEAWAATYCGDRVCK